MSGVFCCSYVEPYRPRRLDHEPKFTAFLSWASRLTNSRASNDGNSLVSNAPYAVQIVRQINFGPQESIRYFVPASNESDFVEATEDDLLTANFEKLNSYKNFRCNRHNRFFEVNLYKKDAINTHHWRANLARPSRNIDLQFRQKGAEAESGKVEEVQEQEETQKPLSSSPQRKTSFPALHSPVLQALQARQEVAGQTRDSRQSSLDEQPAGQLDIATLKRLLRFLLPAVGASLGTDSIISLLALDWTNKELALDLELETLWDAELTSSNITIFLLACFERPAADDPVNVAEIEALIIPAMRHVELFGRQQMPGRTRLQEIVARILEHDRTVDWVSKYGADVARVLASGPSGELLERCRRQDDELQQDRSNHNVQEACEKDTKTLDKKFWSRGSDDGRAYDSDDSDPRYDYDYDNEYEPMKDFTACDQECGYCGNCDY